MAAKRIPELDVITGANTASDDMLVVYDTSAGVTKRILRSQLAIGVVGDLPYTPSGGILATTVPNAIAELDSESVRLSVLAASTGAALIGNAPSGTIAATTVQGAINEIVSDLAASSGTSIVGFLQAGAGAVARTAQSKMRDELVPEDFGAAGDGSNDTVAFAAALTAAVAQGKTLRLRTGATYLLDTWTVFSNSSQLRIEGCGAIVKGPASTVDFLSPAANFNIEGVVFDRWNSVVERLLASTGTFTDIRFVGNTVKNCNGQTFNIERPITNYWIERNLWDTCTGGYAIKIGENTYANQNNYTKGTISRNNFFALSASSTTSCAAMLIYGREVTIEGNIIDGVQGASGEGWGIYTKTRYATIRGNILRNIYSTSSADVVGINVKGTPRALVTSPQGFSVVCSGNQLFNVGVSNVKGICIRIQTDDVICTDNICEDSGLIGIAVDDSAGSYDHIVANNKIWFSSNTGKIGIAVDCNGARIAVRGNDVRNASLGVRMYPIGGGVTSVVIDNNTLNAVSAGISLTPFNNITRLRITNNVVDGGSIGVLNNGGAGVFSGLQILDNDFTRCSNMFVGDFAVKYLRQEGQATTTTAAVTATFVMNFEDETSHIVESQIVGKKSDTSDRAMYWKRALVYRNGGGATIQGAAQSVAPDIESAAGWDGAVSVGGNLVTSEVTGAAATTIDWTSLTQVFGSR